MTDAAAGALLDLTGSASQSDVNEAGHYCLFLFGYISYAGAVEPLQPLFESFLNSRWWSFPAAAHT